MALKTYFTGTKGLLFWFNVLLALAALVGIPYLAFELLDSYTHHGEKVEVPNVVDMQGYDAQKLLDERNLFAIVGDSDYNERKKPGVVLAQMPKPGNEVKSGRIIYLTINRRGEAPARMPDLIRNTTVRIAERQLKQMGFNLTPTQYVENEPKDLVLGIKQGMTNVYGGEMVSRDRAITIIAGKGIVVDSLEMDSFGVVSIDGGFNVEL
ncbi:MAG: PASTA domain-containing protein [Bacteroidaceae bacterium]|nr:PASTA domain-containing protein [Bacteroidaceae bacterium]